MFEEQRGAHSLSHALNASMSIDPLSPILYSTHLKAIDRRRRDVMAAVERCIVRRGRDNVIIDDKPANEHT